MIHVPSKGALLTVQVTSAIVLSCVDMCHLMSGVCSYVLSHVTIMYANVLYIERVLYTVHRLQLGARRSTPWHHPIVAGLQARLSLVLVPSWPWCPLNILHKYSFTE